MDLPGFLIIALPPVCVPDVIGALPVWQKKKMEGGRDQGARRSLNKAKI